MFGGKVKVNPASDNKKINLCKLMERQNIDNKSLADFLGVSIQDVIDYQNNVKEIPTEYHKKLADFLQTVPTQFK